jgi:hypothetical protein
MATKFTLASLRPTAQDMLVTHPTHGVLDFTLKIQGGYTPSVRQKSVETLAWLQSAQKENKPVELANLVKTAETSAAEVAALAIVGWSDDEAMGGPYTPEYAAKLMSDPGLEWLRKQVNTFVSNESNFFRPVGE